MSFFEPLNKKLNGKVVANEILAPFTTYKIGGPAQYYFKAENQEDLKKAVLVAKEFSLPYFILARGSNILISDKGFAGLVIHNKSREIKVNNNLITADSGVNLTKLSRVAKDNSLSGLEFGAGIPGSLGGAIRGNAGAFGQEIKKVVKKVMVLMENGEFKEKTNKDCLFDYRESVFKHNQEIILSAVLRLKKASKEIIEEKINEVITHKRYEQELEAKSAGCAFKNPRVNLTPKELDAKKINTNLINQKKRIPAAYLIEEVGLKGFKVGQAMVSNIHANFIINLGEATAENVVILIGIIKQKVRTKFSIQLQEEIQYVGF